MTLILKCKISKYFLRFFCSNKVSNPSLLPTLFKQENANEVAQKPTSNLFEPFKKTYAVNYTKEEQQAIIRELERINEENIDKIEYKVSERDLFSITPLCIEPIPEGIAKHMQKILRGTNYPDGWSSYLEKAKESNQHIFARTIYSKTKPVWDRFETLRYFADESILSFFAVRRILTELKKRIPSANPKSILDFGSGTATAILAAETVFPSIKSANAIENNLEMYQLGKIFSKISKTNISWNKELDKDHIGQHNLTVAAFSLSEIKSQSEQEALLCKLWEKTKDFLVIVEGGEPHGSALVSSARDFILAKYPLVNTSGGANGATVIAPCSHDLECPIPKFKRRKRIWCHFAQRIPIQNIPNRSFLYADRKNPILRKVKSKTPRSLNAQSELANDSESAKPKGQVATATEQKDDQSTPQKNATQKPKQKRKVAFEHIFRFSYVVLRKGDLTRKLSEDRLSLARLRGPTVARKVIGSTLSSSPSKDFESSAYNWPRIIQIPSKKSKHVSMKLCSEGDIESRVITKSFGRDEYRHARLVKWGDLWPYPFRKPDSEKRRHRLKYAEFKKFAKKYKEFKKMEEVVGDEFEVTKQLLEEQRKD